MKAKRQTSGFPRVGCLVPGCKRGTTRIEPLPDNRFWLHHDGRDPQYICGVHWARVPKALRRRDRMFIRAWRKLSEPWPPIPGDQEQKARQVEMLIRKSWERIKRVACGDETPMYDDIPAAMSDDLRRLGL